MRRFIESTSFLALAAGLHLMLWIPEAPEGVQAAGAGGASLLSLQASSASVAAMVEEWETPPELKVLEQAAMAPPVDLDTPQTTLPEQAEMLRRLDQPELAMPEAPALAPAPPPVDVPRPQMNVKVEAPPVLVPKLAPTVRLATAPPLPMAQAPKLADAMPDTSPPPPPPPPKPPEPKPKPKPKPKPAQKQPNPAAKTEPAQKAATNSRAQNAQRAAGQGNRAAAGNQGAAEVATLSSAKRNSLLSQWGAKIRARIARRAPRGAGKGTAVVRITVSGSGRLLSVGISKSSGNAKLDQQAVAAVRKAGRFPKAPSRLGISKHSFVLPITSK